MSTNDPMTQERLDAIRERVDAAQNTPWQRDDDDDYTSTVSDRDGDPIGHCPDCGVRSCYSTQNADLITNAPEDLTDLLAEVERLQHFESVVSWRWGDTTDGRTREDMVERAARTLYLQGIAWSSKAEWDRLPDPVKKMWHLKAGAVLDAALGTGGVA